MKSIGDTLLKFISRFRTRTIGSGYAAHSDDRDRWPLNRDVLSSRTAPKREDRVVMASHYVAKSKSNGRSHLSETMPIRSQVLRF